MPDEPTTANARASRMAELRAQIDEIDAKILKLCEKPILDEAEDVAYEDLNARRDIIMPEYEKMEQKQKRLDEIAARQLREVRGTPEYRTSVDDLLARGVDRLNGKVARDAALRILDDRDQSYPLATHQQDHVEKLVRSDPTIAARVLVTENDAYRSAWHKSMRDGPAAIYSHEEHAALLRWNEMRAASTTTTAGGFGIPVKLAA